jgi:hypothetical protein
LACPGKNRSTRFSGAGSGTAVVFTASNYLGHIFSLAFLAGVVMLANWVMLVIFYLVLVIPILWRFQPPKPVTPF